MSGVKRYSKNVFGVLFIAVCMAVSLLPLYFTYQHVNTWVNHKIDVAISERIEVSAVLPEVALVRDAPTDVQFELLLSLGQIERAEALLLSFDAGDQQAAKDSLGKAISRREGAVDLVLSIWDMDARETSASRAWIRVEKIDEASMQDLNPLLTLAFVSAHHGFAGWDKIQQRLANQAKQFPAGSDISEALIQLSTC